MAERRRTGGVVGRLTEAAQRAVGVQVMPFGQAEELREAVADARVMYREADLLAYAALSGAANINRGGELPAQGRIALAQQSREVWDRDPQLGGAVDLLNDFTFGRGVPRPKCHDDDVQDVVDEAWDDPDNMLVLTTMAAQVAKGTDLSLHSNVFFLVFDDGDDGRVKLGLLDHDTVLDAVKDPQQRLRVLYYLTKQHVEEWSYQTHQLKPAIGLPKVEYYEHYRNADDARELGTKFEPPPTELMGKGRVYHVAINRTSEDVFGRPQLRRVLKWFSAYNEFMGSRVDITKAVAAFIMKRKVQGGQGAVNRIAQQQMSRSSALYGSIDLPQQGDGVTPGPVPRPGSILNENEGLTFEPFKLTAGSGDAQTDGQMIRAQISAATRWPQHYLGDASNANLSTATSLELPVLKLVEGRQEIFEQVFRWFIDLVIERAVDTGRLSPTALPVVQKALGRAGQLTEAVGGGLTGKLGDEEETERDLGYEFSMPSPLRRMLTDLVTAAQGTAQAFDPNGTNVELNRTLLTVVLGEGFELDDPAAAVERIFPEGYKDPIIEAELEAAKNPPPPGAQPVNPDDAKSAENNPADAPQKGARQQSVPPEKVRGRVQEAAEIVREARMSGVGDGVRSDAAARVSDLEELWEQDMEDPALRALAGMGSNGHGGSG